MSNMTCPKCADATLQAIKALGIEVDQCPKCEGVWFDLPKQELLAILGGK
jgi:Zn-finger nucleic acid-binding protein